MTDELIRDFKGIWIPKEVWLDKRLNTIDKIILLEIDSLDCTEEGCYASNKYLAEFCQCTETTVSTSINKLIKLEYLELIKFDGRKRYVKSRLLKIERQTLKNLKADFKNFKDINIDNNIINKEKDINKLISKKKFIKPTIEEIKKYCNDRNNGINAEVFFDFYEANGWVQGKGKPIKDWKACVRTWERNNKNNNQKETRYEREKRILEELANEEE